MRRLEYAYTNNNSSCSGYKKVRWAFAWGIVGAQALLDRDRCFGSLRVETAPLIRWTS